MSRMDGMSTASTITKVSLQGPIPHGGSYITTLEDPALDRHLEAGWVITRTWDVLNLRVGTKVRYVRRSHVEGEVVSMAGGVLVKTAYGTDWLSLRDANRLLEVVQ